MENNNSLILKNEIPVDDSIESRRCIKCNLIFVEESTFPRNFILFCENCWRHNTNDELFRYQEAFSWELFQLKYPHPWSTLYKIKQTSDKKYLFEVGRGKLKEAIELGEGTKKYLEKVGNISGEYYGDYKELKDNIQQAQEQYARILCYEPKK